MTYFYSILKPGEGQETNFIMTWNILQSPVRPGSLNITLIRQWQKTLSTISALGLILNVSLTMLTSTQQYIEWTLSVIVTLTMTYIVTGFVRNYLNDYVSLDKLWKYE